MNKYTLVSTSSPREWCGVTLGKFSMETHFERGMASKGRTRAFTRVGETRVLYSSKRSLVSGFALFPINCGECFGFYVLGFCRCLIFHNTGMHDKEVHNEPCSMFLCSSRGCKSLNRWSRCPNLEAKDASLGTPGDAIAWQEASPSKEGRPPVIFTCRDWTMNVSLILTPSGHNGVVLLCSNT